MKQKVDAGSKSGPTVLASGGARSSRTWTITGTFKVRESETEGTSKDRPLKGIEVKVQASDIGARGPWSTWGTARTDSSGSFTVKETNKGKNRFFRVQIRLVSADLVVEDGTLVDIGRLDLADRNWRTVWLSGRQLDGPAVRMGTKVVAAGQPEDLGDGELRRQATIWYVMRRTLDTLRSKDPWFALDDTLKVLYPARSGVGVSYSGRSTLHLQTETDDWKPDTLLFHFWWVWAAHHGSVSESFRSGFASYATMALKHELWGTRLARPYNRRYVAASLALSTMEEIENEPRAIRHGLLLLATGDRNGWWSHRFGTAQRYPSDRPDDNGNGSPDHPGEVGVKYRLDGRVLPAAEPDHLTFWEILRTFRADAKQGRPRDFSGDGEHDLVQFVERACDIHSVSDATRDMLLNSLQPLATKEPYEHLPEKA